jgi:hypothetical protein
MDNSHTPPTLESCFSLTMGEALPGTEFLSSTGSDPFAARQWLVDVFNREGAVISSEDEVITAAKPTPAKYFLYKTGFGLNIIVPHSISDRRLVSSTKLMTDKKFFDLHLPYPITDQDPEVLKAIENHQKSKLVPFLSKVENVPIAFENSGKAVRINNQVIYYIEDYPDPTKPGFHLSSSSSSFSYTDDLGNENEFGYNVKLSVNINDTAPIVKRVEIKHALKPKESEKGLVQHIEISSHFFKDWEFVNECKLDVGDKVFIFDNNGLLVSARGKFTYRQFPMLHSDYPRLDYASVIADLGERAAERKYKALASPLQEILDGFK